MSVKTNSKHNKTIENTAAEQLYDGGQGDYDILHALYRSEDNLGMHYGFWETDTKSIWEAQQNENEYVSHKLSLTTSDLVLDAGCGIGGTAIPLAKKYQYHIHGITISEVQVNRATEYAEKIHIDSLVTFSHQDFHHTNFRNDHFNKIYSVESANYANPPRRYLKEMHRILQKSGRLLVVDAYLTKPLDHFSEKERKVLDTFCLAWCIPNPQTVDHWLIEAKKVGFKKIQVEDLLHKILPSAPKFGMLAQVMRPFYEIGFHLGLLSKVRYDNMVAARLQQELFEQGVLGYHSLLMTK